MAAVAYTLTAVGTLALLWAVGRRAPRGRETGFLLVALLFLALQYGAMGANAFVRSVEPAGPEFTLWTIGGQTALVLFWGCVCLSLRAAVARLVAPQTLPRDVDWSLLPVVAVTGVAALGFFGLALLPAAPLDRAYRFAFPLLLILMSIPGLLFRILYQRMPKEAQVGWTEGWTGAAAQVQLTSLNLAEYPPRHGAIALNRQDYMRLFAGTYIPMLLLIAILLLGEVEQRNVFAMTAGMVCRLMILPGLMSVVYFQARYSFFDVVVKRGVLFIVIAKLVSTATWFALPRAMYMHAGTRRAAFSIGAVLVVWASVDLFARGERLLDRIIFRRSDYRFELQRLNKEMARCADSDSLRTVFTSGLARVLRAESVESGPEPRGSARLMVRVGTGDRVREYLALGDRDRGQQYRSEDLNFIDAASAQYSALLESFEARQSERLAAAAEVRALRAQINPHFLFNALNTVADMARAVPEAERAILNLSRVFRYALDSTRREAVKLGEEIGAVRSYLEIEGARFEARLQYAIEVGDDLLDVLVPPMLIQPLVENAVKHGIAPKACGGTVRVAAEWCAPGIRVTVSDDGVGFDPSRTAPNIGMGNVRARVERDGGTMRVESRPGTGTEISLELVRR